MVGLEGDSSNDDYYGDFVGGGIVAFVIGGVSDAGNDEDDGNNGICLKW